MNIILVTNYKTKINMKTKKHISKMAFLTVLLITSAITFAQPTGSPEKPRGQKQNEKRENIEAQKIAFITKKLNLSPEEAQQFWPIYNQLRDKQEELRKQRRQDYKEAKDKIDQLNDKEVEKLVDNEFIFRQKELDLQKEYCTKFKAVLPIKKVAKLYEAEEQFKGYLLKELKHKQPGRD